MTIEYKIVKGIKKDVEEEVTSLLNDGWQLAGDVYFAPYGDPRIAGFSYAQAMVRHVTPDFIDVGMALIADGKAQWELGQTVVSTGAVEDGIIHVGDEEGEAL